MRLPDSIRSRLRLSHIGLAAVPLLIVGVVLTWSMYFAQQAQVSQLQQELARRVVTQIEASINSLESDQMFDE